MILATDRKLSDISIAWWIRDNKIVNEKGEPIDFKDHPYLYDIYCDRTQNLDVMKAAQVGMSTCEILKNHWDAKSFKIDIIYTLPTDADVSKFVDGKVNRIIANNPCMLADVKDKDSIEMKAVGPSRIYFLGTFTKKAAIMITADRLSHDERDSSKQDVISDFQARLQHSKRKETHTFSHPSLPEFGVHKGFLKGDQKHWFVKCGHCQHWQFLSWDMTNPKKMSVDIERRIYVCKRCHGEITDDDRRFGQWVAKYPERSATHSSYWVPLMIVPTVPASYLIDKYFDKDTTPEFFYTKMLGLPFADGTSKLLREHFMQNITGQSYAPGVDERVIIGIDTGKKLDYVLGNKKGLFFHGDAEDYAELDGFMTRWPKAIAIIDAGGDLIGAQKFAERWPGRVFKCYLAGDRMTNELTVWGKGDEHGAVRADRNRMIQLVVDEFRDKRIPVFGSEDDWYEYYQDWQNLTKVKVLDPNTGQIKGYKWQRSSRDHRALATVFWRVGMMRFKGQGFIATPVETSSRPNSYMVNESKQTASFDPKELFDFREEQESEDWRNQ